MAAIAATTGAAEWRLHAHRCCHAHRELLDKRRQRSIAYPF